ncbi:MAG: ATP-dependent Clp protease adaptor ClpS [Bryobacterales bacterium]|nr:ATP-dependent Clp protease adaptor ClpS [Bryobacterales bacterium]
MNLGLATPSRSTESREEEKQELHPLWNVVLLDDDHHTCDYVIEMLCRLFVKTVGEAYRNAVEVDATGAHHRPDLREGSAEFARDQIHGYGADWRMPRCKGSTSAILEKGGRLAGGDPVGRGKIPTLLAALAIGSVGQVRGAGGGVPSVAFSLLGLPSRMLLDEVLGGPHAALHQPPLSVQAAARPDELRLRLQVLIPRGLGLRTNLTTARRDPRAPV